MAQTNTLDCTDKENNVREISVKTIHTCDKCGTKIVREGDLDRPPEDWAIFELNYYRANGTSARHIKLDLCQRCARNVEFFAMA